MCIRDSLYGATKLASDKLFVAANNIAGGMRTRFSVVRYGNVVGSRGSVVPFFRSLVAAGKTELPITDPRMTRFWITLEQGVDFVLQAFARMHGGEIFVPKIPSALIPDLATAIAPNLPHRTVGIRPGEKLHEIMVSIEDARSTYEFDTYFKILPQIHQWSTDPLRIGNGKPCPDGFAYSSDTNKEWMQPDELTAWVRSEYGG